MDKFERTFSNPMDDVKITDERALDFTNHLSEALEPVLSALSQELDAAMEPLAGASTAVATALAARLGKTRSLDLYLEDVKKTLRAHEPGIEFSFGSKSAEGYLAFFPGGLEEYNDMTKVAAPTLLDRIRAAADLYADRLDPRTVAALQGLKREWDRRRSAQEAAKGATALGRTDSDVARRNLDRTVFKVLHTMALHYIDDLAAAQRLCDFNLLYPQAAPAAAADGAVA